MQRTQTDAGGGGGSEGGAKKGPNWLYMTPLLLTLLPLIRHAFKDQPVLRTRLFFGAIGVGICHGAYLIVSSTDEKEGKAASSARIR